MTKKKSNMEKWMSGISAMDLTSKPPVKQIEVQTLEQRWGLLKAELEQLEDFYSRCNSTSEINVIHDIQNMMIKMESHDY